MNESSPKHDVPQGDQNPVGLSNARREVLTVFSLGGLAGLLSGLSGVAQAEDSSIQPPRRALTARDENGKSVFHSFDVTPRVVNIESRRGLVFWEMYATDGTPTVSGREADPMTLARPAYPDVNGSYFRVVLFPPRLPEGTKPAPE